MRVVVNGEPEVIRCRLVRLLDDVFAAAEQLDDAEREVGEAIGIGPSALQQELFERPRVGRRRQLRSGLGGESHDAQPAFRHADDAAE